MDLGELGQEGVGGGLPLRRCGLAVLAPPIAVRGRLQRGRIIEAAVHHLMLQGAEPGLDPVQPGD